MSATALHTASAPSLRIRWDRVTALAVVVLLAVALLAGGFSGSSRAEAPAPAPVEVVIQPGDTLWSLARAHAPAGMGTMEFVALVEASNDVSAGRLVPGRLIEVPQGR